MCMRKPGSHLLVVNHPSHLLLIRKSSRSSLPWSVKQCPKELFNMAKGASVFDLAAVHGKFLQQILLQCPQLTGSNCLYLHSPAWQICPPALTFEDAVRKCKQQSVSILCLTANVGTGYDHDANDESSATHSSSSSSRGGRRRRCRGRRGKPASAA